MKTPTEQQELASRIAAHEAQRVASLWLKPVMTTAEAAAACSIPLSTWRLFEVRKITPRNFKLGRKKFIQTAVLRAWLDQRANAGAA